MYLNNNNLLSSIESLKLYIEKEDYKGYDPYDLHNSLFSIQWTPHVFQFLLSQINKRSPINIRPLLGIKKNYHTKAIALLLSSYCNLYSISKDESLLLNIKTHYSWIVDNINPNFSSNCWGFDYDYTNRNSFTKKGTPTIVHHSYVLKSLYKYYLLTQDKSARKIIVESLDFILKDLPKIEYAKGICFGYYPKSKGCTYNASLHAAESLAIINIFLNDTEIEKSIINSTKYVISRQKKSGLWYYSHNGKEIHEKMQVDFHQGFILESLYEINKLTGEKYSGTIIPSIILGTDFYKKKQFNIDGSSLFRYPKKYPIDIHNQAQGIITFAKLTSLDDSFMEFSEIITNWTIKNMQSKNGYFYYQKYRLLTNKISYIRWSQAWMFFALSELLLVKKQVEIK